MPLAIIITGHGHFADGMKSALELISGPQKDLYAVNFAEGDTPEALSEKLAKTVKLYDNNGVVIFCDIIGGAPFRQAALLASSRENLDVVYGTTLHMLVEAVLEKDHCGDVRKLVADLLPAARDGIGSLSTYTRKQPPPPATEEGL
mgnify:CR=1 FL=1